jgi:hypothetical protein
MQGWMKQSVAWAKKHAALVWPHAYNNGLPPAKAEKPFQCNSSDPLLSSQCHQIDKFLSFRIHIHVLNSTRQFSFRCKIQVKSPALPCPFVDFSDACGSFSFAALLMNGARTQLFAAGDITDTNSIVSGTNKNRAGVKAPWQTAPCTTPIRNWKTQKSNRKCNGFFAFK